MFLHHWHPWGKLVKNFHGPLWPAWGQEVGVPSWLGVRNVPSSQSESSSDPGSFLFALGLKGTSLGKSKQMECVYKGTGEDRQCGTEWTAHLLDVSVGGLPHVVILYDAGERLPGQLWRQGNMMGGRDGATAQTGGGGVAEAVLGSLQVPHYRTPPPVLNTANPQEVSCG